MSAKSRFVIKNALESAKADTVPGRMTRLPEPEQPGPFRVSLNSFGYGGTNAHVILEPFVRGASQSNGIDRQVNGAVLPNGQANGHPRTVGKLTNRTGSHSESDPQLFLLTAASEGSLLQSARNLREWILAHKSDRGVLSNLAYTLSVRRSLLPVRCSVIASTCDELATALQSSSLRGAKLPHSTSIAFIFTGQGAQWHAMGRELIGIPGAFRDSINESDRLIRELGADWKLIEELSKENDRTRVADSALSQPLTTAIQVAIVDLMTSYGVVPQYVCGHSSGEIGAAYAAGALSQAAAIEM